MTEKKQKIKEQIERIRNVFDMTSEDIKKHPQLKKLQEYLEEKDGAEKYIVGGNGDTYVVYDPEYTVSAK